MTEHEEADRLIDQINEMLRRDSRFPRLSFLECELMFRDLQRDLDDAFGRIFEAGYQEGKYWAELEEEDADH
jgi:hypothetical protein